MKPALLWIALLCGSPTLWAQTATNPFDQKAYIDRSNQDVPSLTVTVPLSSIPGGNNPLKWQVIAVGGSGSAQILRVTSVSPLVGFNGFTVNFSNPTGSPTKFIVVFDSRDTLVCTLSAPCSDAVAATTSREAGLPIYFNGSYSPAIKSPPQYQIAGSVAPLWHVGDFGILQGNQIGMLGTVSTDKRQQANPDSYEFFAVYQGLPYSGWYLHGLGEGILLTWLAAGTEFDHATDDINVISAPYLDFPLRLFQYDLNSVKQAEVLLIPTVGAEAGHNFYNAVTPTEGRAVLRGVMGATLNFHFDRKVSFLQGIELSSSYTLRLPATDEIFTNTKTVAGKVVDFPYLSTKARQSLNTELDFKLTKTVAIAVKHVYGAIPPAFRMVHNQLTIGITYGAGGTKGASGGANGSASSSAGNGGENVIPPTLRFKG